MMPYGYAFPSVLKVVRDLRDLRDLKQYFGKKWIK